jgi:hypothetical protein
VSPCCHKRCSLPVVDGTTRCEKHTAHHRAEQATRIKARRALGRCGLCPREAVLGKARCELHDASIGAYRCSICGERGHNRLTCASRPGVLP